MIENQSSLPVSSMIRIHAHPESNIMNAGKTYDFKCITFTFISICSLKGIQLCFKSKMEPEEKKALQLLRMKHLSRMLP